MSLNTNPVALLLVGLIVISVLGNNQSMVISSTVLLLLHQTKSQKILDFSSKYGLSIGIIILTIGVLAPLVSGKINLPTSLKMWLDWKMLVSIAIGILVAWFGGRGVHLMGGQPFLLTGILVGTVIGVAFFNGIPVGPLIAAGMVSMFVK